MGADVQVESAYNQKDERVFCNTMISKSMYSTMPGGFRFKFSGFNIDKNTV